MVAVPIITVDGPSGSGKGTLCKRLAARLGWHLLDSGALYRVVALASLKKQIPASDEQALGELARNLDVKFEAREGEELVSVLLDGEDVTSQLRLETTGNQASIVAAIPAVRAGLLERQRDFAMAPGLVADGRDMGTVVFPHAPVKIYLTASSQIRAERRYKQLIDKGIDASLPQILSEVEERDRRDMERAVAPLKPAEDAVLLDSTAMDADTVLAKVIELAEKTYSA